MLKKTYRLRKNQDFQAVYQKKNSVAAGTVVLYIRKSRTDALPKVGFSVSKKIGNAVVRNRCRRLMREAVRKHLVALRPERDYILIGRAPLARADFSRVERDVLDVLKRKDCLVVCKA